jgi:hypothetical protein
MTYCCILFLDVSQYSRDLPPIYPFPSSLLRLLSPLSQNDYRFQTVSPDIFIEADGRATMLFLGLLLTKQTIIIIVLGALLVSQDQH